MEKFAFYDFDDTLLKHDSMAYLVLYYVRKHPLSIWHVFWIIFLFILYLLKIVSFKTVKEAIIFPLDKMTDEEIQDFYDTELIKRYYPHVIKTLEDHVQNGYHVWLVSASPEAYLCATDLPVEKIIGTTVLRQNGHWTHQIVSANCKGEEKVRRIQEELAKSNLEIDYAHSYAYSDSTSDWPMLCLVQNRFRIHKKNGEITPFVREEK